MKWWPAFEIAVTSKVLTVEAVTLTWLAAGAHRQARVAELVGRSLAVAGDEVALLHVAAVDGRHERAGVGLGVGILALLLLAC